jgi:hypothetical protein
MIQIKVCEHYISKFGNAPSGIEIIFIIDVITPSPVLINYLKHLKENQQCYNYSGLTVNIDDILKQMKDNLLEMLKILGE